MFSWSLDIIFYVLWKNVLVHLSISLRFMACLINLLWTNTADAIQSPIPKKVRIKAITSRKNMPLCCCIYSAKGRQNVLVILRWPWWTFALPVRLITIQKKQLVISHLCGRKHEPRQQLPPKYRQKVRHQMLNQSVHHVCYANLDYKYLRWKHQL